MKKIERETQLLETLFLFPDKKPVLVYLCQKTTKSYPGLREVKDFLHSDFHYCLFLTFLSDAKLHAHENKKDCIQIWHIGRKLGDVRQTVFIFGILFPTLAVASPIREALTALGVGKLVGRVGNNLDPQEAVGEVAIVEGEGEIRLAGGGRRVIGVHNRRSRVK